MQYVFDLYYEVLYLFGYKFVIEFIHFNYIIYT